VDGYDPRSENDFFEEEYYDIHGQWPEGSKRAEIIPAAQQFWKDYTDSVCQEYNRAVRLWCSPEAKAKAAVDPEFSKLRDEALLYQVTGRRLTKPAKKTGKMTFGAQDNMDSFSDEAILIDLENAMAFLEYADTTDPTTVTEDARQALMDKEGNRFPVDTENALIKEIVDIAERRINQSGASKLGDAATGGSGYRKKSRKKSKEESVIDMKKMLMQDAWGKSVRTGAQTAGRGTDVEHIIAAKVLPEYNNEAKNKYPGPKYLNRAYGNAVGGEQIKRAASYADDMAELQQFNENPKLLELVSENVPEMRRHGVKHKTNIGAIARFAAEKLARFAA